MSGRSPVSAAPVLWYAVRLYWSPTVSMAVIAAMMLLLTWGLTADLMTLLLVLPFPAFMTGLLLQRAHTGFALVLPVSPSVEVMARYLMGSAITTGPALLWFVVRWARGGFDASADTLLEVAPMAQASAVVAFVCMAFTVSFALATRPLRDPETPPFSVLQVALVGSTILAAMMAVMFLPGPWLRPVSLASALAAVALVVWRRRHLHAPLPSAVVRHDEAIESDDARPRATVAPTRFRELSGRSALWWPLLRVAVPPYTRWFMGIFGALSALYGYEPEIGTMPVYAAAVLAVHPMAATRMLTVLPFPAWKRLALIMGVGLGALAGGFGVGWAARSVADRVGADSLMTTSPSYRSPWDDASGKELPARARVRFTYWQWARGGTAPAIEAPWGERVTPFIVRTFGVTWFNPYSVRPTNSTRFADWQWERLTTVMYGQAVPYAKDRDEWPPLRVNTTVVRVFNLGITLALGLLLVLATWYERDRASSTAMRIARQAFWVPVLAYILLPMASPDGTRLHEAMLEKLALLLASHFPSPLLLWPVVLLLTVAPTLLLIPLLRRAAQQPALEFTASARG